MTNGKVVILDGAGRNFGAGMSGGIALVLDESGEFLEKAGLQLVVSQGASVG